MGFQNLFTTFLTDILFKKIILDYLR